MDNGDVFNKFSVNNYSFNAEDTFDVKLISKSDHNCYDTFTRPAITFAQPIAMFIIPNDTQCWQKHYFNFNNQTILKYGTLTNFWQFGDNTTSTEFNPSSKSYINKSATYLIKYRTVSEHGCSDSTQRKIVLLERPISEFSINDSIQCFKGHLFTFINKTTFSIPSTLSYWWDYNNGNTNNGINPKPATYNAPGLYNVSLVSYSTITNCFDTLVKIVIPAPHANVDFTLNKDTQCFRFNYFRFTNSSILLFGAMKYQWSFRDNTLDTAKNPTKHYMIEKSYKTKLVVNTNYDCKDSIEKSIEFYETPIAKMAINQAIQCSNKHAFDLTNLSTIKTGNFTQNWVFADASIQSTYNVTGKTFNLFGDLPVYLAINSNNGCKDTAFDKLYLEKSNNSLIGLNSNDNDSQCFKANSYRFTAINNNVKVSVNSYDWQFGDGQSANSSNPSPLSFKKHGHFLVTLYTISANGCLDTAYHPIVVHPQPMSLFKSQAVCFPEPVKFVNLSNISTGTIDYTTWYFGDGNKVIGVINPVNTYKQAGNYNAGIVNISNYCCIDSITITNSVVVNAKPKADFSFNRLKTIVQDETRLQFKDESSADVNTFNWNFGNSTFSNQKDPIGIYHDTGRFHVTEIVFNAIGCSDTITKPTGLLLPDFYYYLPNTFTPNNNLINEEFKGVGSQYIYKFTMEIYNRWGQKVFESHDINKGWDGTYEGEPCMEGNYMCRIYLIPLNGPKQMIEQMLTLLK